MVKVAIFAYESEFTYGCECPNSFS
ncbi:hypothetical protein F383_39380 [Gossypium arboreum]|uniref:Uncharacterized protein n=1 Tax=Gossypium arboreum TaxID=29729 RepID=A0A0B0MPM8_GOSAR|nr:hypothetical protein F383_39380 [Gossypium arboreum]